MDENIDFNNKKKNSSEVSGLRVFEVRGVLNLDRDNR